MAKHPLPRRPPRVERSWSVACATCGDTNPAVYKSRCGDLPWRCQRCSIDAAIDFLDQVKGS